MKKSNVKIKVYGQDRYKGMALQLKKQKTPNIKVGKKSPLTGEGYVIGDGDEKLKKAKVINPNPRTGQYTDEKGEPRYERKYDLGGAKKEYIESGKKEKQKKHLEEVLRRYRSKR